jgi:hypothetical protein
MSPKPKPVPKRLGPPPQFMLSGQNLKGESFFSKIPMVQQKMQPKMHEIMSKQAKMIARWLHDYLTWKKILMTWMVVLVASKMVLLMLTYEYFSLTALISLQVRTAEGFSLFKISNTILWILIFRFELFNKL